MLGSRDAGKAEEVIEPSTADFIDIQAEQLPEYGPLSQLTDQQAKELCEQLRTRLLDVVSKTGGHLASNLGVVELTVAIHRVFDTQTDRLVFDVGHQSYIHKMLTGRNNQMETLRTFGGLAGFPKPAESIHDAFIAGHASNAVSVALGMAIARSRLGESYQVLALLGDGALTGGLSYEGLSSAGQSGEPMIVILNDNGMSISKNVGGIARYLARQRIKPGYFRIKKRYRKLMQATPPGRAIYRFTHRLKEALKAAILPGSMFESMGFHYIGPVDGHDLKELTGTLEKAKTIQGPVFLHVWTEKGKGYAPAEQNPDAFHGTAPFQPSSGESLSCASSESFSSVFGEALCSLAKNDPRICAITAAMEAGTGLSGFAAGFSERFFDVGIAEGHAVSMAAGMAKQGIIPIFAVYSTFLQRSYDMLIHDVAIQGLHVVFCVDRAGFVGDDGETHHGMFDVAYLTTIPGMTVLCPASLAELPTMLEQAIHQVDGPVALRYPRGGEGAYQQDNSGEPVVRLREGGAISLLSYGSSINLVLEAAELLANQGMEAEVLKLNQIAPLDITLIGQSVEKTGRLMVVEEVSTLNCIGEQVLAKLELGGITLQKSMLCNCGDGFVTHGSIQQLRKLCGLDPEALCSLAKEVCGYGD